MKKKGACGKDIVLDRDGNAFATGYVTPDTNHDYGTVRIPKDWNGSEDLAYHIWDNNNGADEAVSIDLSYEVESSVLKIYAYVTGTADPSNDDSDIGTLRYDVDMNLEWYEVFSNGSYEDAGVMVVAAGAGNAYVIGRTENTYSSVKKTDYVLLGYRRASSQRFSAVYYNGTASDEDEGRALAMAGAGLIRATGKSKGYDNSTNRLFDFATIEKTQSLSIAEPHSDYVTLGYALSGDLAELYAADNTYRVYSRDNQEVLTPEKIIAEFFVDSPISAGSDPSEICVRYEGKCSVNNIKLKIEVYNVITTS